MNILNPFSFSKIRKAVWVEYNTGAINASFYFGLKQLIGEIIVLAKPMLVAPVFYY